MSDEKVTANQSAVIAKYGFVVTRKNGNIEVTDKVKGTTIGKTLEEALKAAVAKRTSGNGGNGNGKPAATATQAAPATATKAVAAKAGKTLPNKSTAEEKPETAVATEVEDVELDNTGKRERKGRKQREKVVRKDNRYLRAAKVLVGNPFTSQDDLSAQADMSPATAQHCLDAWEGVTTALMNVGAFTDTWVKRLTPAPKAKAKAAAVVSKDATKASKVLVAKRK